MQEIRGHTRNPSSLAVPQQIPLAFQVQTYETIQSQHHIGWMGLSHMLELEGKRKTIESRKGNICT